MSNKNHFVSALSGAVKDYLYVDMEMTKIAISNNS